VKGHRLHVRIKMKKIEVSLIKMLMRISGQGLVHVNLVSLSLDFSLYSLYHTLGHRVFLEHSWRV